MGSEMDNWTSASILGKSHVFCDSPKRKAPYQFWEGRIRIIVYGGYIDFLLFKEIIIHSIIDIGH